MPTIDEAARDIETKLLGGLFPGERVLAVGRCADIPELANILSFAWGNSEEWKTHTSTAFAFSRRDTEAATALRSELERRGIVP